nr:MAG TPA: hypothetical protein [Caudoviricetes sp.]
MDVFLSEDAGCEWRNHLIVKCSNSILCSE